MFVVILRYPDPAATAPYRDAHVAFIQRHVEAGTILLSGPQEPRAGGAIIVRAPSRAAVEAFVAEDPYGTSGAATHEIIEFHAVNGALTDLLETRV